MATTRTALAAFVVAALVAGCGWIRPGSEEALMNPVRIHESGDKQSAQYKAGQFPVETYYKALELAKPADTGQGVPAASDPAKIRNYVYAGVALVDAYCIRWFHAIEDLQRQTDLAQKDFNVLQQLGTALLGIGGANSYFVAGYGAANTAISGMTNNFNAAFLAAPTTKKIKVQILNLVNQSATALKARADETTARSMEFAEAYAAIERHADICTFGTIREVLDAGISQPDKETKIDTSTGQITMVSVSFVKDDAGDRIRAFWKPDGETVNKANEAKLLEWKKQNGLESVSITSLIRGDAYASARQKAVADLAIPELKK